MSGDDERLRPHEDFPEIWYDMDDRDEDASIVKLRRTDGTDETLFDLHELVEMSAEWAWDAAFEAGLRAGLKIAKDRGQR